MPAPARLLPLRLRTYLCACCCAPADPANSPHRRPSPRLPHLAYALSRCQTQTLNLPESGRPMSSFLGKTSSKNRRPCRDGQTPACDHHCGRPCGSALGRGPSTDEALDRRREFAGHGSHQVGGGHRVALDTAEQVRGPARGKQPWPLQVEARMPPCGRRTNSNSGQTTKRRVTCTEACPTSKPRPGSSPTNWCS